MYIPGTKPLAEALWMQNLREAKYICCLPFGYPESRFEMNCISVKPGPATY